MPFAETGLSAESAAEQLTDREEERRFSHRNWLTAASAPRGGGISRS
jgi:hypothetical protein